jgi:molybdopterin-guanine dinucleotide biosynthesis protein A
VVAVGKASDGLTLPFPLVDDEAEERAPVFGVLAGLRVASHDVAVFLPVDCPLVAPATLRALGEAVAVPRTGPLPGAYARVHLSALEARVARGELTLRGVNITVLGVDEAELADVDTPGDLGRLYPGGA